MAEHVFNPKHLKQHTPHLEAARKHEMVQYVESQLNTRLDDIKQTFDTRLNVTPASDISNLDSKHYDLITTNLTLPWVEDVPGYLLNLGRALKPDGLLLASALGAESFNEFRHAFDAAGLNASGHTLPLPDVQALGSVMQTLQFALPVVDRDIITLGYPGFAEMYYDLRAAGSRNLNINRAKSLTGRRKWARMETAYRDMFQLPDGDLPLTLEIIYLHGWRPAKGQPKPLPPGSATVDLGDILSR